MRERARGYEEGPPPGPHVAQRTVFSCDLTSDHKAASCGFRLICLQHRGSQVSVVPGSAPSRSPAWPFSGDERGGCAKRGKGEVATELQRKGASAHSHAHRERGRGPLVLGGEVRVWHSTCLGHRDLGDVTRRINRVTSTIDNCLSLSQACPRRSCHPSTLRKRWSRRPDKETPATQ